MAVLSRKFILDWLRDLGIEIDKIEDIGKGDALCALLKMLDPRFPPYKKNPANTGEYLANLRLAQAYFTRNGIKNYFPIDKMANLKLQDNLEVIQWFYKYWQKEESMKSQANKIADLNIKDTKNVTEHVGNGNTPVNKAGDHPASRARDNLELPTNLEDSHIEADMGAKKSISPSGQGINSEPDGAENDLSQSLHSHEEIQDAGSDMVDEDFKSKIKTLQESEREKIERIETLKNYVKISYSETKFYFGKLERIEGILTDKDLEFTSEVRQKILDILYEDN